MRQHNTRVTGSLFINGNQIVTGSVVVSGSISVGGEAVVSASQLTSISSSVATTFSASAVSQLVFSSSVATTFSASAVSQLVFSSSVDGRMDLLESTMSGSLRLYVSPAGKDTNNGLDPSVPFKTIKAAVESLGNAIASNIKRYTIFVGSGNYTENNPIAVPPGVAIVGDTLRTVRLTAANPKKDYFHCHESTYFYGLRFLDLEHPAFCFSYPCSTATGSISAGGISSIGVVHSESGYADGNGLDLGIVIEGPDASGSIATATADVVGGVITQINVLTPGSGYVTGEVPHISIPAPESKRPVIGTSPYVQNCSSITGPFRNDGTKISVFTALPYDTSDVNPHGAGGGIRIDGNLVSGSSPLESMVADAFTQVNQGGPGHLVINKGYAQFVSCFTTFCTYGFKVANGGFANISNSVIDFGNKGLIAKTYFPTAYNTGSAIGAKSSTVTGFVLAESGSGYTGSVATVTISGGGGTTQATAEAKVVDGAIREIRLLTTGSGYTSQPDVVIASPNGTAPLVSGSTVLGKAEITGITDILISLENGSRSVDISSNMILDGSDYLVTSVVAVAGQAGQRKITTFPAPPSIADGAIIKFHQLSNISTGGIVMEYGGSGVTYNSLPKYGGVPIRTREINEIAPGRVFYSTVDNIGNIKIGDFFAVNQLTGEVTINSNSFNLSGLNAIGPFKRNGNTAGVVLNEVSDNINLVNAIGLIGQDTSPTQFAVKGYVDPISASLDSRLDIVEATASLYIPFSASVDSRLDQMATTGSNTFIGNQTISGSLNVVDGNLNTPSLRNYNSLFGTPSSEIVNFTVLSVTKTSNHRYFGTGSAIGYHIDGVEAPFLTLLPGKTYRFYQEASNNTHQLRFYYQADRTTPYTTNVTHNGTAGQAGAYTQIVITDTTPIVLHYQCINHGYMGNSVGVNSNAASFNTLLDKPTLVSSSQQINNFGIFATTGSNTFKANQIVSGSLTVTGNLNVFETASFIRVTSSVILGGNTIQLNTLSPVVRFGGVSVIDSGSSGLTGSLLWDSQTDKWIYSNPSGGAYNSAMLISGPKNTSGLGNELGLVNNYIVKAVGDDHISSSQMQDDGVTVTIPHTASIGNIVGLGNPTAFSTSVDSRIFLLQGGEQGATTQILALGDKVNAISPYTASVIALNAYTASLSSKTLVSGSSQLTASYDSRYIISGTITQTTWDNIASKPAGIVSGSSQIFSNVSGDVTIASNGVATIAANSVALGTDTTGNYVASLVAGTNISFSNNSGEGATPTIGLTSNTISGISLGSNLATLTISTGLGGTSYNGSGAVTIANTGVTSNVAGGAITVSGATGAVTINHADTSTAANLTASGRTYVSALTFDTYGHVTGYSTGTETVDDTNTVTNNIAGTGVSVSAGTGNSTISIGQSVATSATVQFGSLGIGMAASATTGRIDATNDIVAYASSDRRFKENITPIENALDKISKISGYEFDWKVENKSEHGYEGHDLGVIAQEIEVITPELVQTRENGYKAVKYDKLVAVLIEGIKEQQTQINSLTIEIEKLKESIG